jgi:hypothetical protein
LISGWKSDSKIWVNFGKIIINPAAAITVKDIIRRTSMSIGNIFKIDDRVAIKATKVVIIPKVKEKAKRAPLFNDEESTTGKIGKIQGEKMVKMPEIKVIKTSNNIKLLYIK